MILITMLILIYKKTQKNKLKLDLSVNCNNI